MNLPKIHSRTLHRVLALIISLYNNKEKDSHHNQSVHYAVDQLLTDFSHGKVQFLWPEKARIDANTIRLILHSLDQLEDSFIAGEIEGRCSSGYWTSTHDIKRHIEQHYFPLRAKK